MAHTLYPPIHPAIGVPPQRTNEIVHGTRRLPVVAAAAAITVLTLALTVGVGSRRASATTTLTQPTPSVTASDFPIERQGSAPADGNGLIPNPATPTGSAIAAPTSCTVTFDATTGSTSADVNSWIAGNENSITATTVVCLSGTFTSPIHVWSKYAPALLEIAPAPSATATLDLGQVVAADVNPNVYFGEAGGVSIVDSRGVEIYGLTVENFTTDGTTYVPSGIDVTVRSDTANTNQSTVPHESACFLHGDRGCSDIYILDNTLRNIANTADENFTTKRFCGSGSVDAYGISVIAAGSATSGALQHVVVEGNTVSHTRTGQSETITVNGDITDFLVANNVVHHGDNIGMDTIGWETGSSQARHGLVQGNTVYNIDTYNNAGYGQWSHGRCRPTPEGAGGIYNDGGAYIWINDNTVWNTNQGISLDCETAGKKSDHLLVSGNTVVNEAGTSFRDPSIGANPPGTGGTSTVAGHDSYAFYVDAYGPGASIGDVYAHGNIFVDQSQYYLKRSYLMPVVDLGGGLWSNVEIWHNTIEGLGPADRYNPLLAISNQPSGGINVVNCNNYVNLSGAANSLSGNFATPSHSYLTLHQWQASNGHGWDANSEVNGFSLSCPAASIK